jgi:hypothetical protein
MPEAPVDSEFRAVYEKLITRLRDLQAGQLSEEIERAVRRGVVVAPDAHVPKRRSSVPSESSVSRPMTGEESLAVALEYIVAWLGTPIMLDQAKHDLQCEEILWKEGDGIMTSLPFSSVAVSQDEILSLRNNLQAVVKLITGMNMKTPEVP